MIILNQSMYLTLHLNDGFSFFNGENFEIKTNSLPYLKQIVDWYCTPRDKNTYPQIKGMSSSNVVEVVQQFIKYRLIIPYTENNLRLKLYYDTYGDGNKLSQVKKVRILVIGCGTAGAAVVSGLAKMGVAEIDIVDNDVVTKENVEAQSIYTLNDVGRDKGDALKEYLESNSLNSCKINYHKMFVKSVAQLTSLFEHTSFDYVIDCADVKDEQFRVDIIDMCEMTNCALITSGYYEDEDYIFRITNDFADYKNFTYDDLFKITEFVRYSVNRGVIIDSSLFGAIVPRIIINDLIYGIREKVLVKIFNESDVEMKKFDLLSERKKFNSLKVNVLKKVFPRNEINRIITSQSFNEQTYDVHNAVQYLQLLEDINVANVTENGNNLSTYKSLFGVVDAPIEDNKLEQLTNSIAQQREVKLTNSIWNDMRFVAKFGGEKIQKSLFDAVDNRKDELINLLRDSIKISPDEDELDIYGVSRDIFSKFIKEINSLGDITYERSQVAIAVIKPKDSTTDNRFDFLNYRDVGNIFFGSKTKAIKFVTMILKQIDGNFSQIFKKLLNANQIIIDPFSNNNLSRVVNLTNKNTQILYSSFDGTYQSVVILLHEVGHLYANQFMNADFYWNDSNKVINESIADSFVLAASKLTDVKGFSTEYSTLKEVIRTDMLRKIEVGVNQIIFVQKIAKLPNNRRLSGKDYDEVMGEMRAREPKNMKFENEGLYNDNYLVTPTVYNSFIDIVQPLMITLIAKNIGDNLLTQLKLDTTGISAIINNYWHQNNAAEQILAATAEEEDCYAK